MDGTGAGTDLTFSTALAGGTCFEKMRITDTGNVGIGTDSPSTPLVVNATTTGSMITIDKTTTDTNSVGNVLSIFTRTSGTAAAGLGSKINFITENSNGTAYETAFISAFTSDSASAQKDGVLSFSTADGLNNPTERMRINSSGNVGIGNTSPQNRLVVGDGSGSEIMSIYAGSGNSSALHFTDTNTTTDYQGFVTYNHVADALRFGAAEAEVMRITSTGLGIGESDPDYQLVVSSSATATLQIKAGTNTSLSRFFFGDQADLARGFLNYDHNTDNLIVGVNNAERMRILSTGGLTFNGDTAAANALDDYEEGEWTPTCPNVTPTGAGGHYTKVGNRVWVTFYLQFPTTSDTNPVQINNLPFTVKNHDSGQNRANANRGGWTVGYSNSGQELRFIASSGTTTITAHRFDGTAVNNNNVSAKSIYGGGYYEVA